jgi:hypothetical protein
VEEEVAKGGLGVVGIDGVEVVVVVGRGLDE